MAFEREHGARAVPVASGLAGAIVGIGALVGSLTFSASLDHLLATPRLVGWNWDGMAFLGERPPDTGEALDPDDLVARVRGVVGVERAGYGTIFPAFDDPVLRGLPAGDDMDAQGPWPVTFSSGPGSIAPTVVEGRAPSGPAEVLLTRAIADQLGLAVGDAVELHGRSFIGETDRATTAEMTVVGIGVLPVGDGSFERSLSMTFDALKRLATHARPDVVFFDLADGTDVSRLRDDLTALGLQLQGEPDHVDVDDLVDLDVRRADTVPSALGLLMAVLAAGVLAHLVLTAVRRREHDLATLQALGMRPRDVARVVSWQMAFVWAVTCVAAGIGGVVVGREVWLTYARRLGVVPELAVPALAIAATLLAFGALALVVARDAARRQRRRAPGTVLRSE